MFSRFSCSFANTMTDTDYTAHYSILTIPSFQGLLQHYCRTIQTHISPIFQCSSCVTIALKFQRAPYKTG